MGENKVLKVFVWTPEDGRPFGRRMHGMEYDVKMDLREM
jgi:hypothetical protein